MHLHFNTWYGSSPFLPCITQFETKQLDKIWPIICHGLTGINSIASSCLSRLSFRMALYMCLGILNLSYLTNKSVFRPSLSASDCYSSMIIINIKHFNTEYNA
jgi:hypothetical protein